MLDARRVQPPPRAGVLPCFGVQVKGKIKAWGDPERRQSRRIKNLGDIARLIEAHPQLWESLPEDLKRQIERP